MLFTELLSKCNSLNRRHPLINVNTDKTRQRMTPTHPAHQPSRLQQKTTKEKLDRSSVKYQAGVSGTLNFRPLKKGDLAAQPRLKES